jgi:hypothetical protein
MLLQVLNITFIAKDGAFFISVYSTMVYPMMLSVTYTALKDAG